MNIHEYQAKQVLKEYGVPVPQGGVAFTADEAVKVAEKLGGPVWVVKAQIHAGGRGKGGGVKVVKSLDEVRSEAERMLGMTLITHQTGPEGREVGRIMSKMAQILPVNFISLHWLTARLRASLSSPRPKVVWILKKWRKIRRKKSSP
jgi:succinyl-CoA synthetase beta subunit